MTQITTTLNKIRNCKPCEDGWENLLKYLGKTKADDEPLKFSIIAESNGIEDAIWCLRSIFTEYDKEIRLFVAAAAESVLHIFEEKYPEDKRPRLAIEAARKFTNGKITKEELHAARDAAWDAAEDAAEDAAWAAARAAAEASALAAAEAAAEDAAAGAAWAAENAADAAEDANTERQKQKALLTEMFS